MVSLYETVVGYIARHMRKSTMKGAPSAPPWRPAAVPTPAEISWVGSSAYYKPRDQTNEQRGQ